ncbi:MAG: hypothetical protein U1F25_18095 [Rubrivivax sp.]
MPSIRIRIALARGRAASAFDAFATFPASGTFATFATWAAVVAAATLAGCAIEPPRATEPVAVKILAINDFHGNLRPSAGGIRIKDPADATKTVVVPAGGSEHLATLVAQLRATNPNHIFPSPPAT